MPACAELEIDFGTFRDTEEARAERDVAFREALLSKSVDALLAGDADTGRAALRDATIGFETLAEQTGTPAKSRMRMLEPRNLFLMLNRLQNASGVSPRVRAAR